MPQSSQKAGRERVPPVAQQTLLSRGCLVQGLVPDAARRKAETVEVDKAISVQLGADS